MNRRKFLTILGGAAVLSASYPVLIERNIVLVNRYRVLVRDLPASFHGFTIAHLTDLHLGFLVSDSFIDGIVTRTNELQPDLIACTGDYVHERNTRQEIDRVWPFLARLRAKDGVYSVLGNHDHWADFERSLYWLEKTGQNIRHSSRIISRGTDRVYIGGAGDHLEDKQGIDKAFGIAQDDGCKILLAHNPDTVDTEYSTRLSLVLSGHTHGGQVVLPFIGPPVLPVKNKKYTSGLIPVGETMLFISRGIGWAIYPVRFNCYPEIALLELQSPAVAG